MWEINSLMQLQSLLYSVILGAVVCVFYDILSALRLTGRESAVLIFIEDIGFWIVTAVCVFLFLIGVSNGEIRVYILLGILLGFILLKMSLSKYITKLFAMAFKLIKKLFIFANKILTKILEYLIKFIKSLQRIIIKIFNKSIKNIKKLLKIIQCLLYTNSNSKSVRR